MKFDLLPVDCIAHIFSFTTPCDACRSCLISSAFRSELDIDAAWEKFLPSDHREILSRSVSPVVFSSKKELFFKLCNSLLIDEGKKIFSLDKSTGKKSYTLSARELSIAWGSNPLYWSWKPLLGSRFAETVELVTIWWLEINGKINTRILSPKTTYVAYLIVKFADRAYKLDSLPSEVSIEVGNYKSQGKVYLRRHEKEKIPQERSRVEGEEIRVTREREDGWVEIELGEFYIDGIDDDQEVKMSLKEVKDQHLKGGLIVDGMEVRPKG